jgi:protoporphyrinogen oxidase
VTGDRAVAIVGGGILGLTAAYRLAQAGVGVELYERSGELGGLVGSFELDGHRADRFYHVVLPTDDRVRALATELGLGGGFRFRPAGVGFYDRGRLFSLNTLREFAVFPLLPPHDRLRLAAFVARCQLRSEAGDLDDRPLEEWLRRLCGRRVVERLWRPLLDSKFDGRFDDLPATYLWARTRRMSKTRDAGGHEVMGSLAGGYQRLIDALAARVRTLGGRIRTGAAVESIGPEGIRVDGALRRPDLVLCTLAPPQARRLLHGAWAERAPADHCRYLGVVCLLLRARRSVSPYYTLNITDRRVPLTTVVETTHVVDPLEVGGHLVYAAKYVAPDHPDLERDEEELARDYLAHVRTIFPGLRDEDVEASVVQRARVVEPVHLLGGAARLPDMFPTPGLALASTAHVYPEIVNGQSVLGVAERAVEGILQRLPAAEAVAA